MNSKRYDIVGLGVSTVDFLTIVDHFSAEEEVQEAYESTLQGGGPVATALTAASRLGASTAMLDCVGNDWRGRLIVEELIAFGVDTKYLNVLDNRTSSIASIIVRKRDGKRAIIYSPGTASEFPKDDLPLDDVANARIVHVNGRHWPACKHLCMIARENGVKVSFDGGAGRYRPELDEFLRNVDYCIISKGVCDKWIGEMDAEIAAERIIEKGAQLAVITMGEHGSFVRARSGETIRQPAFRPPQVVDTTGCGDIYHGAFLYGLCFGYDLRKVAEIASAAAAMKAQRLGGRGLVPTMDEIQRFIASEDEFHHPD